jgi:hypothetical protein
MILSSLALVSALVNLQWSICDSSPEDVLEKLGAAETQMSQEGQISYYDSNPPTYTQLGLSFRTKERKGETESSVKVRFPQRPANMTTDADCSWERYGSQENYTCEVLDDFSDEQTSSPWSSEQMDLVSPYHAVDWRTLVSFGPYSNPKWKVIVAGSKGTFDSAEAGSLHLMELEIVVSKIDDDRIYAAVTSELLKAGVSLCPVQEGKTPRLFRAMGLLSDP